MNETGTSPSPPTSIISCPFAPVNPPLYTPKPKVKENQKTKHDELDFLEGVR